MPVATEPQFCLGEIIEQASDLQHLGNCTVIVGNLDISNVNIDLANNPLSLIQQITGYLRLSAVFIKGNHTGFSDLFPNLTCINALQQYYYFKEKTQDSSENGGNTVRAAATVLIEATNLQPPSRNKVFVRNSKRIVLRHNAFLCSSVLNPEAWDGLDSIGVHLSDRKSRHEASSL